MATTKRSTASNKSTTKRARSKSSLKTAAKKSTRSRPHKTAAKKSTRGTARKTASSATAHKTGRKTAHGQAWTDKRSENPSSTGHGKAKKEPAKQKSHCWPGYEPVPGKARGTKGSCKPKKHQTAAEKKSDAMAAAASKQRKGRK